MQFCFGSTVFFIVSSFTTSGTTRCVYCCPYYTPRSTHTYTTFLKNEGTVFCPENRAQGRSLAVQLPCNNRAGLNTKRHQIAALGTLLFRYPVLRTIPTHSTGALSQMLFLYQSMVLFKPSPRENAGSKSVNFWSIVRSARTIDMSSSPRRIGTCLTSDWLLLM